MAPPLRTTLLAALALAEAAISGGALAADARPAAMVMTVSGSTEPALVPRAQIEEGARFILAGPSRITFVLFGQCGLYTASSGTLIFGRGAATSEGGTLERGAGPCSRAHVLGKGEEPMVGGGANLRAGRAPERIGPRPSFLIGGPGAARVVGAQLAIADAEGEAIAMVLKDGRLSLPAETLALRAPRYLLRVLVSSGVAPPALPLLISRDAGDEHLDVLLLE